MDDLETSFVNRQKADDEELQELLSRMKKKTKALHPGPDYCFQNDPIWAPGEERPGPEPDPEKRLNNVTWCKCHNCTAMKSVTESICCLELEVLEHFLPESVTCVTQNTEFSSRCLDQETLVTAMITQTINYGRSIDYRKPKCFSFCTGVDWTTSLGALWIFFSFPSLEYLRIGYLLDRLLNLLPGSAVEDISCSPYMHFWTILI
ncbi:uncharacterized protein LOC122928191 isoform X2 [Bufo gargarizans]|nr:uncharacterized protein LOC122928191 isoform X2 [Bufo gargarizans]